MFELPFSFIPILDERWPMYGAPPIPLDLRRPRPVHHTHSLGGVARQKRQARKRRSYLLAKRHGRAA